MSLRSGLSSSFTIGNKLAILDANSTDSWGLDSIIALSLRLDPKDRLEPKLDLEDLFLLSFIKLLI